MMKTDLEFFLISCAVFQSVLKVEARKLYPR